MKIMQPAWIEALRHTWRSYVLAGLSLLLIWGVAAFAWGSLNAWAKRNVIQNLQQTTANNEPLLGAWLAEPFAPLEAMLRDPVLQMLPTLPLGLASPAAQRWLDTQAQNPALRELVLADMATGRTLLPNGNTPILPEVLGRIGVLQQTPSKPFMVASGSRNAIFYAVRPLPMQPSMVLILPRSLRQLAPAAPRLALPVSATLGLHLPHVNGMVAVWNPAEPMRLETAPPRLINSSNVPLRFTQKFKNLAHLKLEARWVGAVPGPGIMPYALILFWALAMSVLVLWAWIRPVVQKARQWVAPYTQPLVGKVQQGMAVPHGHMVAGITALQSGLGKLANAVRAMLEKIFPVRRAKTSNVDNWRKTGGEENVAALTDGPGGFLPRDFDTGANKLEREKPSTKIVLRPLNTELQKTKLGVINSRQPNEARTQTEEEDNSLPARVLRCLNEGLLELFYQPIYKVTDGSVYANEVLARLADDDGQIMPGQFIPILATMGKLADLDALVFERVMALHFNGRGPSSVLSLNISGNSLEDLSYLRDVVHQGQSVLQNIIFEVRSNEVVRDPNALQLLRALQRQGAKVAIDYFGGGEGMVKATHAIGLDIIKADAMKLLDKNTKKDMLEMSLAAAKLNVPVVMEKIEDKRTEEFARHAGVKYLQGYGLGKPTPTLITLPLSARLTGEN